MHQNRLPERRRLVGLGGMVLAALLLITALFLFLNMGSRAPQIFGPRPATTPTLPPVTCKTPAHQTGDTTGTIQSAGLNRTFLIHLAPSYGRQAQPLVINYHGYDMSVHEMEQESHMDTVADQAGFVLVYPQAVDSPTSWNAGVGAYGPTGDADDVQFTRDLLSYLETNYCVDTHRVYLTGFSLGGGMVYRLACTLSTQITAIATVSGAYYPLPDGCPATRPMPVLEIHGAADPLAPYAGNTSTRMAAVQDYLNGWLERDQCDKNGQVFLQQGDVTATTWSHCAAGVVVQHYRVSDGRHHWFLSPSTAIDSSQVVWNFFKQFVYPPYPLSPTLKSTRQA